MSQRVILLSLIIGLLFSFKAIAEDAPELKAEPKADTVNVSTTPPSSILPPPSPPLIIKGENIPDVVKAALKGIISPEKTTNNTVIVNPSQLKGLYEIVAGANIFYVSDDGQHVILGDLRHAKTGANYTDDRRKQIRSNILNTLDEKELVVFEPEEATKYTVNIFTDVDCPYCAKIHEEVPELNKAGVKVRYLAFPRAGVGSPTYNTMVSVWCADDKKQAMTNAKTGVKVEPITCDDPVNKQYQLGQVLGVTGTPALYLADGEKLPGYVPAKNLISYLKRKDLMYKLHMKRK